MISRFVELHFSELPSPELSYIIEKRCKISSKASKKLIAVMHDLQVKFMALTYAPSKILKIKITCLMVVYWSELTARVNKRPLAPAF